MSNNKQSSVEWFKKELEGYGTTERLIIDWKTFDELFEQAKAMHKEEIEDAYDTGKESTINARLSQNSYRYYNETFGYESN